MKRILSILGLALLFTVQSAFAQQFNDDVPDYYKRRYLSEAEMMMPFEPDIREASSAPQGPLRMVGEFEPMQAVMIRYPLGIPYSLIAAMSQDIEVITIVNSNSQANFVLGLYNNNGVNTDNCSFMVAGSNSYWTRDYGPWFIFDGNNQPGIVDFPYNRPRPADNAIPGHSANYLGINYYYMNLLHTGGNLMVDGLGTAASTDLVYEENASMNIAQINQLMEDYLGVTDYDVTIDPLGDYIKHIDTWAKYLAPDKILIGQVPPSDPRYNDFETVVAYFENRITPWGYPYKVYRVYTPGGNPATPYTNSTILNNKVFVPITGSQWDAQALAVYEEAMPGYDIVGIYSSGWYNTDALHCRTREVADLGMLFVDHRPHFGELEWQDSTAVSAEIIAYSGESLHADSLFVYYSINGGAYQQSLLFETDEAYTGYIKNYQGGDTISYYLYAADASGRNIKHPYMGHHDPHQFIAGEQAFTELIYSHDTLYFMESYEESFMIINPTNEGVLITDVRNMSGGAAVLNHLPDMPYFLESTDTLTIDVEIEQAQTAFDPNPGFFEELIHIETELGDKELVVMISKDLLTGLHGRESAMALQVYPNPFTHQLVFELHLRQSEFVEIQLFDIQGRLLETVFSGRLNAGKNQLNWEGTTQSGSPAKPGIYLYKIRTQTQTTEGIIMRQ